MTKAKLKTKTANKNLVKPVVRRSIEVLPDEFLLMLSKGKEIIHSGLADTLNEFGQVYYTCVKDGEKRRCLYCA